MEKVIRTQGKRNFLLDGFPRSLNNLEGWYEIYGKEAELPKMLYFECPYEVLEKRILGRAKYSGRSDDNVESMKLRFDTFKAETLPTVELFKSKNKCVEVDTSQERQAVYALCVANLQEFTDPNLGEKPLTERAEMLLGLRPYPKKVKKVEVPVHKERTFIMVKPDGVQRGLVGIIIERFEQKGFKLCAMKLCTPSKEHLEAHYADLKDKKFFPSLIEYMCSGPVIPMVWEGDNAVLTGRKMLGATKPFDSAPGTIRGDFCIDVGRNLIHGSDAVEAANHEIGLWFKAEEINVWEHHSASWIYE